MEITVKSNGGMNTTLEKLSSADGVEIYALNIENESKKKPERVEITLKTELDGGFSSLNSTVRFNCDLMENWQTTVAYSRANCGSPLHQTVKMNGNNMINIALADAITPIEIRSGFREPKGGMEYNVILFTLGTNEFESYRTLIRIDRRDIPFYESLEDVSEWWKECGAYKPAYIPKDAKKCVYSTWCSFQRNIDVDKILAQCGYAKKLGMDTLMVDGGWQTDIDGRHGFGDWIPAPGKIADMKAFVDRVHEIGMKFILWYGVPFVSCDSDAFKRLGDKTLYTENVSGEYGIFDPRYKEVREHIAGVYEKAMLDWGLDGFKLDFIEMFKRRTPEVSDAKEGMDIKNLEDGINRLYIDIHERLTRINPDVMIEFRENYIGPSALQCATMLRVCDCAGDAIRNRKDSIDTRLLSGGTPIHCDMLTWDMSDTAEHSALQIINSIFCVPQISVMLDELPAEHYRMLKYYLKLWNDNAEVITEGRLRAENPEANYSIASTEYNGSVLAAAFSKNIFRAEKAYKRLTFINGTGKNGLIVDGCGRLDGYKYKITDCMGEILETGTVDGAGEIIKFEVAPAGVLVLEQA